MAYKYKASETSWRSFYALSPGEKLSVRTAWEIFRVDPFDPRLKTHKIHALSGREGRTIWSASIESDLRVIFYIEGSVVFTVDIGSHAIYR